MFLLLLGMSGMINEKYLQWEPNTILTTGSESHSLIGSCDKLHCHVCTINYFKIENESGSEVTCNICCLGNSCHNSDIATFNTTSLIKHLKSKPLIE